MLKLNLFPIFLISTLTFTFLEATEINYEDTSYIRIKNDKFKWTNIDGENA
jgi:hypothetical protein